MKRSGFTIVEIMVSVIVLALLASGIFSVIISARYLVARSKFRVAGIEIARSEIEKRRGLIDANTWAAATFAPNGVWTAWDSTTYPPYRVRYRIDGAGGGAEYRKFTVQVAWDEARI